MMLTIGVWIATLAGAQALIRAILAVMLAKDLVQPRAAIVRGVVIVRVRAILRATGHLVLRLGRLEQAGIIGRGLVARLVVRKADNKQPEHPQACCDDRGLAAGHHLGRFEYELALAPLRSGDCRKTARP